MKIVDLLVLKLYSIIFFLLLIVAIPQQVFSTSLCSTCRTNQLPQIIISNNTQNAFCNNKTNFINVYYNVVGFDLQNDNFFTVQLSDEFGSFANNSRVIGSPTQNNLTGYIPVMIPLNLVINGNYKLRIISSSSNTAESVPYDINIYQGTPTISITSNRNNFCKGSNTATINGSINSINYNYAWLINNQIINNVKGSNYTTDINGKYKLVVSNTTCADTSNEINLVVYPKPKAAFECYSNYCYSEKRKFIELSNTSTISSGFIFSNWIFSDGTSDNVPNPVKNIYKDTTSLTISLIISSSNGCDDMITKTVTLKKAPDVFFYNLISTQCFTQNKFEPINNTINATSYLWNFGDNTFSNAANPIKMYNKAGGYTVLLMATNETGCSETVYHNVNVLLSANLNFTINNAGQCLKNNYFEFTNQSSIPDGSLTYLWKLGQTDTSSQTNAGISFIKKGTYKIELISTSNSGCKDTLTKEVVVSNPVIDSISGNTNPTTLTMPYTYKVSNEYNSRYNWTVTNGVIQSGQGTNAVNVVWATVGSGKLKAKLTNVYNCTDSTSINITVLNVGINDINKEEFIKVFPNPTKNELTIVNQSNLYDYHFSIANILGQTLISGKLNLLENHINMELLSSGIYLLNVEELGKHSIKIIKE